MNNCGNRIYEINAKEIITIEITILFENNETKTVMISENDLVEVTFIEEATKSELKTRTVRGRVSECNSSYLIIDHSTLFESNVDNIYIKSIRDIDKRDLEAVPLETKK